MLEEKEVVFIEAHAEDAAGFIEFLNQVNQESDFLIIDPLDPEQELEQVADILAECLLSNDRLCLLAKIDREIVGLISVMTDRKPRLKHIGDVFMAVSRDYWNHGIGQILIEEAIIWAKENHILRRLELTVQAGNSRAVHIYQKFGFKIEGTKIRGASTEDEEFLDVYLMGKLID
ncbi:GNAT family N-acetyltransferase [Streptococcus macacae]|uniref:Acetyltransferase, GNAT family n=1 Tax=Streptococcus macacae NCTC 11558 TaxID=764298 RepID=G5JXY2_9STRE|nr:GNAT family N-acetyltransferase [Streptococcus macacae]EHJ52342.1 acetyltransferase, GNAT family [Streptococcus macacae NCTC 11558]SUN77901.1 histone acetyltransferase HPA2-like acetyltransferase [Streptococcus macacae NCTC 11558]